MIQRRIRTTPISSGALVALFLLLTAGVPAIAQQTSYDHFLHGFDLDGAHAYVECESCHRDGIFQGIPRQCSVCHDGSNLFAETSTPFDHINTTSFCDGCHTTAGWRPITFVDHGEVVGSCSTCHDGTTATGKDFGHITSGDNCEDCHSTLAWLPARFDHTNLTVGCIQCHNGATATGKDMNHILTTDVCEDCHSVDFWAPAVTVDHTQVLGTCFSCHDGSKATGKDFGHIPSSDNCDDCHTTRAWTPAVNQNGF